MDPKQKISDGLLKSMYRIDLPQLRPTTFHYNFAIFLVVFVFSLVGISLYIDAPTGVEVTGKLVLENPAIPVKSIRPIVVHRNQLVENQIVTPGQVLLTSTFGMSIQSLDSLKQMMKDLEKAFNSNEECLSCFLNIAASSESIVKNADAHVHPEFLQLATIETTVIQRTAERLQATSKSMRDVFAKIESSDPKKQKRNVASQGRANGSKAQDPASHQKWIESYQLLNLEYAKDRSTYKEEIERLMAPYAAAKSKLESLERSENITAPLGGKITNVKVKGTGEFINPGQVLFELVPEKNDLIIQLEIPNKDISLFQTGESVEVAIDAFPEFDYGRITAQVIKILEPDSNDSANPNIVRGFRAQAVLQKQHIEKNGKKFSLLNGMSLKARVHKERESLFTSFLRTIFKFKQEAKT